MINYDDRLAAQAAQANALRDPERTQVAMGLFPKLLLGIGGTVGAGALYKGLKKKPAPPPQETPPPQPKGAEGQYLDRMERQLEQEGR